MTDLCLLGALVGTLTFFFFGPGWVVRSWCFGCSRWVWPWTTSRGEVIEEMRYDPPPFDREVKQIWICPGCVLVKSYIEAVKDA